MYSAMTIIGYAKASQADPDLKATKKALKSEGCTLIFKDPITPKKNTGLSQALSGLSENDTFMILSLSHLGKSIIELLTIINSLVKKRIHFISLEDKIDTRTTNGKATITGFQALIQYHKQITTEQTKAGIAKAKTLGRFSGRPKSLNPQQIQWLKTMQEKKKNVTKICKQLGISRPTYYNYVQ